MSDFEKVEFLNVLHSDNLAVQAVLCRYNEAVKDANSWHILAVKNPNSENIQESYAVYRARFRMASQFLDDIYMALRD